MLTAGAMERLRRVHVATLKDAAVIERPVAVHGAGGANTGTGPAFAIVDDTDARPIACRMSPAGAGAMANEADQNAALNRWLVAFDIGGPPIGPGYRVTITGSDAADVSYTRRVVILGENSPRTTSAMRVYVAEDAGPGRR